MNNQNTIYSHIRSYARARILDYMGLFTKPTAGIHILNGHRIQEEVEPKTFHTLLHELSKYVSFIRIEDAVQMIMKREKPQKPLIAFTFDDGFIECYDIFAPILEHYDTNALFFINPNYVEGNNKYIEHFNTNIVFTPGKMPMRWKHLKELAVRGHIIGAHTMDHFMINSNNESVLKYQIESCKDIIEREIGTPCDYFAFPYGKLTQANTKSIDIACHQYKYVFSQSDYKNYFSFNGKVINRRHFEPFWPFSHVSYFLSCKKRY